MIRRQVTRRFCDYPGCTERVIYEKYCRDHDEKYREEQALAQDADREMGIEEMTDPLTGWKER